MRLPIRRVSEEISKRASELMGELGGLVERGFELSDEVVEGFFGKVYFPRINVLHNNMTVKVEIEAPGVDPKQIKIDVTDGRVVTVSGEIHKEENKEWDHFFHEERKYGKFERTFPVPGPVDSAGTRVRTKDGIITVVFNRKAPQTVTVNVE